MLLGRITVVTAALLMTGCGASGEPDTGEKHGEPFLRCARPYDDGVLEKFRLPPLEVERNGHSVTVHGITRGLVVFGLLAGITEPTEANLKNVDFFLSQFKAAGVQSILIAGGLGRSADHVNAILDRLARAPVPILLSPGAEENFDIFRKAVETKRKTNPQLLDMTRVRRVRVNNVTVVSLPGHNKPFYLAAGKRGCAYDQDDLEKTASLFEKERTTVILAPSPPRGIGQRSVDRSRGGVNIGDTHLARVLASSRVRFGLFGYVYEAGGHATHDDSTTQAVPGVWQESLFLQAGTSEAVPISLVGEGRSVGMAQIVEFSGRRGRFRTILAGAGGH